jgi:hypothetical protein
MDDFRWNRAVHSPRFERRGRATSGHSPPGRKQTLASTTSSHLCPVAASSDQVVRRLSQCLPDLQRLWDEEATSGLAPRPEPSSLPRADVDGELSRRLTLAPVVTIAGMAGLGKSHAAAAFAEKHADDYDLTVWLEAGAIKRIEDLKSLPLVRAGETRNVTALLKTRACLLVIDDADPGLAIDQLATLCGPKSHVILTQRERSTGTYEPPLLGKSDARAILDRAGAPCPDDIFDSIWSAVGGHPLSLNLLRATVQQKGATWSEIAIDCRAVGELPPLVRGQKLLPHQRHVGSSALIASASA